MANLSDILTNYQSVDTLDSVTDRGATTTNAITIGNLTSTGIDDNATSTALTIDSSGNIGIGTTNPTSYWVQADNLVIEGTGNEGITIATTAAAGNNRLAFVNTTTGSPGLDSGGLISYNHDSDFMSFGVNGSEEMRIDSSGNVGINETTPSGLTGNTSGVGTSSKFKVTGSVGSTQIANTGNLLAFSRDGANYISATGSSASIIYDTKAHYFRNGSEDLLVLGTNSTTGNKFLRTEELQYTDSNLRESARYVAVSSYWVSGEYVEICEIAPGGASQNYLIEAELTASTGQVGENVKIVVRFRSNTLPAVAWTASYDKERVNTSFGLTPYIWHDNTTGTIKLVVKSGANIHNADFTVRVQGRTQSQVRENVTIGDGSELTSVTSGYTEYSILEKKNQYWNNDWMGERKPASPQFLVNGGGAGTNTVTASGGATTYAKVLFGTAETNVGSHFDLTNNRFVAPIAGFYQFNVQLLLSGIATSEDSIHVLFRKNGGSFKNLNARFDGNSGQGYPGYGGYMPVNGNLSCYLNTNDYLEIFFGCNSGTIGIYNTDAGWMHWSGYLAT